MTTCAEKVLIADEQPVIAPHKVRGRLRSACKIIVEELQVRPLIQAILALLPVFAMAILSGDDGWSKAMLVTISLIVGKEAGRLAPVGVLLHGLAMIGAFMVLIVCLPSPILFVAATAAAAAVSLIVARWGARLRTVGNFTFIPTLYLACEVGGGGAGSVLARGVGYLPYMAGAILPVLLVAVVEHARDRDRDASRAQHIQRVLRRAADHGKSVPVFEGLLAIILAVGSAATIVEAGHLNHGQWMIWSAASVVMSDFESSRRKLRDRCLGAVIGVPIGTALGLLLPQAELLRLFAEAGAVLTLLAFRRYLYGFAARCTLVALILADAARSPFAAWDRVDHVLIGGGIGLLFVVLVHAACMARTGEK